MTFSPVSARPAEASVTKPGVGTLGDWVALVRPRQWVKNLFVLAPLMFSGRLSDPQAVLTALGAFGVFCLLASGVYLINDVADVEADRAHPIKRLRPIAAGNVPARSAVVLGLTLWAIALPVAWFIRPELLAIAAAYLVLNLLYSAGLKRVVILDVFAIAAFFVLRLLAGAAAISVTPSIWLLLCGGLLALYLGFAKRRHELSVMGEESTRSRSVLAEYSESFLDQVSIVLLSVTIVSYIMYTVSPDKVAETGYALAASVVFVLYGVFRYLYLVHQRGAGSPTETLLADRSLMVDVVLWIGYCSLVIYRPL